MAWLSLPRKAPWNRSRPSAPEHGVDEPEVGVVDELPDERDRDAGQDGGEEVQRPQGDRRLGVLGEVDAERQREDRLEDDDDQHELEVVAERVAEQVVRRRDGDEVVQTDELSGRAEAVPVGDRVDDALDGRDDEERHVEDQCGDGEQPERRVGRHRVAALGLRLGVGRLRALRLARGGERGGHGHFRFWSMIVCACCAAWSGRGAADHGDARSLHGVADVEVVELEPRREEGLLLQPRGGVLEVGVGVVDVLDREVLRGAVRVHRGVDRVGEELQPLDGGVLLLARGVDAEDEGGVVDPLVLRLVLGHGDRRDEVDRELWRRACGRR